MDERTTTGSATALEEALDASLRALRWIMRLVFLAYLASGVFVVRQHERAVVLRFGRLAGAGPERVLEPGLHWTWPRPVAEVVRVPAGRVHSLDLPAFWPWEDAAARWRGEEPSIPATLRPGRDGYLLSADLHILHARWTLRYAVRDVEAFLFGHRSVTDLLRNELERAVVRIAAVYPVDKALRTDLEAFRADVENEVRRRLEERAPGVRVERVDLVEAIPPRQTADAFHAVVAAEQERSGRVSAARAEATRLLNDARGREASIRAEALAFMRRRLAEVQAEADAFLEVREELAREGGLLLRILYQEGVRRALAGARERYVLRRTASGAQELRLLLNPGPRDGSEDANLR